MDTKKLQESQLAKMMARDNPSYKMPATIIKEQADEIESLRQQLADTTQDSIDECICKGNWSNIVKESEPLFGRKFMRKGVEWTFYGVVHADDDYYYGMSTGKEHTLLSCVGSIENFGFTLIDKAISKDK